MSVYRKPSSPFLQIDFQVDKVRYAFSSKTTSVAEAKRIEARAIKEARCRTANIGSAASKRRNRAARA